ncbi:hypothetical protein R3P38DRAFT_3559743 [Favolaschia claudopus]|uniref:Reverse transcriptase domain-containing protein n=1 Tax=Favolaschia claudopus TaxID=2862362 RepID=A0AAW0AWN5_9AGAR
MSANSASTLSTTPSLNDTSKSVSTMITTGATTIIVPPLPSLRASAIEENIEPLPTVRVAGTFASEDFFDPEDEEAFVNGEEDLATLDGKPIEDSEQIQNPVRSRNAQTPVLASTAAAKVNAAPSSERSMVGQTIRSFESRPGTTARAKADSSVVPLARAASSSTVVTFDDILPSEIEIHNQAGLTPGYKGEKVPAHRARTDDNWGRVATFMVVTKRDVGQLDKKCTSQHLEVLRRLEDLGNSASSSPSAVTGAALDELERLNGLVMEGRTAITNMTIALNALADLPREVARLNRAIQANTNASATPAAAPSEAVPGPAHKFNGNSNVNGSANNKRSAAFAGFNDPTEGKRPKSSFASEPTHIDVYMWNVDVEAASPTAIANRAMSELGLGEFIPNIISVARPRNTPKTLISIRFRAVGIADEFIDRLRSNPPRGMGKLNVAKKDAYEKKAKANDKDEFPCLRVVTWNIHGRLAIKITQPDIVRLINDNDVIVFLETFLRVNEERTLRLPRGFEVIAMSRPDLPGFRCAGGGVAAVIRSGVNYNVLQHLCAPDLLVVDLVHVSLVAAYILPENSRWIDWTDVDPKIKVSEAVSVLAALPGKPVLLKGDINGRVGNRIPAGALLARVSSDPIVNSRGRWLLRLCSDCSMTILNGTTKEGMGTGVFTSFQPLGCSVIDYCAVSPGLIPRIADGDLEVIKSPVWSDHAQVRVAVIKPLERDFSVDPLASTAPFSSKPSTPSITFGEPTALDLLLKATLEAKIDSIEATARLYGPVFCESAPVAIYIGASAAKGRAAFAVWRGVGSKWNCAYMVEGNCTEAKASILAMLCAAREHPPNKSFVVYTSSQYLIRSLCYWAGNNEAEGWCCANGDVLRDTVAWIARRTAPIDFRWVAASTNNPSMRGCQDDARRALRSGDATFAFREVPPMSGTESMKPLDVRKVSTALPEVPEAKETVNTAEIDIAEVVDLDVPHRGRLREREILRDNLLRLLACNGKSSKPFWKLVREWLDYKPVKPQVTLEQLHDSFNTRLNPPATLPEQFDADLDEIVRALNASIPRKTIDRTSGAFFSRRITVEDIQEIKRRLKLKSVRSAVGIDDISYAKIRTIPNEALVTLFHACLDNVDAPQHWLVTLLIGILKEGRVVDDPESYRVVNLECCLLKVLTLLLDWRLREWVESLNLIPESQNGFQPGHRTDDNSFILLCAIQRARAEGKTLYVFFGDMTNAFPYTDVARLWSDMYLAGAGHRSVFLAWLGPKAMALAWLYLALAQKFRSQSRGPAKARAKPKPLAQAMACH